MSKLEFQLMTDELARMIASENLFRPLVWRHLRKKDLLRSWINKYMGAHHNEDKLRKKLNARIAGHGSKYVLELVDNKGMLDLSLGPFVTRALKPGTDIVFQITYPGLVTGLNNYSRLKVVLIFKKARGDYPEFSILSQRALREIRALKN